MTWRTHLLAGLSTLWLVPAGALAPGTLPPAVFCAAAGSLLPDLDAARSKLGSFGWAGVRPLLLLSHLLHRAWGHRGPLHGLLGLLAVAGVPALLLGALGRPAAAAALVLGYASHLALDACTKSGIPLFYPRPRRCHLLPPAWRFTTGSRAEDALLPAFAAPVLALLLGRAASLTFLP